MIFWVLIVFVLMFGLPWLVDRFSKTKVPNSKPKSNPEHPVSKVSRRRRRRSNPNQIEQTKENEFPEYDPFRHDQLQWETDIEPRFRNVAKRLPFDWERRRALVYVRDGGKCHKCGRQCGHLACEPEQIWNFEYSVHLLYDADVHHLQHRISGGVHGLENLVLICLRCHSLEHPENTRLWARRAIQGLG
jgi:hypothetical protein